MSWVRASLALRSQHVSVFGRSGFGLIFEMKFYCSAGKSTYFGVAQPHSSCSRSSPRRHRCPDVSAGTRDSLFHARALPLVLTHVHRLPFRFVQPGLMGIGSAVRPYDLRTLLAAGVCAARRAPSTHAMFGGSACPAP